MRLGPPSFAVLQHRRLLATVLASRGAAVASTALAARHRRWVLSRGAASVAAATAAAPALGTGEALVEVERKLFLTDAHRSKLLAELQVLKQVRLVDTYYDGPDHAVTLRDWWLRQRGATWELKVAWTRGQAGKSTQSYEEVTEPAAIMRQLRGAGLIHVVAEGAATPMADGELGQQLAAALEAADFQPFARVITERTSLQAGSEEVSARGVAALQVDLDVVTFDSSLAERGMEGADGEVPFVVAEVEVLVPKCQDAVMLAEKAIEDFINAKGLQDAPKAYSKLLEYMLRFRPTHVAALGVAGVLPDVAKLRQLQTRAAALRG